MNEYIAIPTLYFQYRLDYITIPTLKNLRLRRALNAGKEYRKDKSKLGKYDNSVVAYIPLPTEL